jgi:hypothetical protein
MKNKETQIDSDASKARAVVGSAAEKAMLKLAVATDEAIKKISSANDLATEKLAKLADTATTAMASAALDANKLVASQAATAAAVVDTKHGNDHDLIMEVRTMQNVMLGEMREIKTGTSQQIIDLQERKLDAKDSYPVVYKKGVDDCLSDYSKRINDLEIAKIRLVLAVGIASTIMSTMIGLIIFHILQV